LVLTLLNRRQPSASSTAWRDRSTTKEELMKRQWLGAFAVVIATTALVGAQQNPQPNAPPPDVNAPAGVQRTTPPPSAQTKAANTVTISGCIQDTPMVTAGASSAAPSAAAGAQKTYYLNNAAMAADAGSPRSSVGTTGATASGYRLDGDVAQLSPHLNHQVRIVGTVQNSNASAAGAANAAPGSTAAAGPTLKVESVTMVSAKCEEKK
jgi:hypothetical protein